MKRTKHFDPEAWNKLAGESVPLARAWISHRPGPAAYLALPGTSYETAALAHRVASAVLGDECHRFSAWPDVVRERFATLVRLTVPPLAREVVKLGEPAEGHVLLVEAMASIMRAFAAYARDSEGRPMYRVKIEGSS